MVRVHPALKKNALRALFYGVITWTVTHALDVPLIFCVGILVLLIGSGIVADYVDKTVMLRKWNPEIWMACFLFVLAVIPYFREDQAENIIIVGNYIVVCGMLFLLSDQFWGFGLERMARVRSNRLKWAWRIWRYAGVIVEIFFTHTIYDSSQHSIFEQNGCIVEINEERALFQGSGFFAFFALRILQIILSYAMVDPEEREKGGSLGRKKGEWLEGDEQ
jgi:hypothetical protein